MDAMIEKVDKSDAGEIFDNELTEQILMMTTMIGEGDAVKKTEEFINNLSNEAQHLLKDAQRRWQKEREIDLSSLEGTLAAKMKNILKDEMKLLDKGILRLDRTNNRKESNYILNPPDFLTEKEIEKVMNVLPASALVEKDGVAFNPEPFFPAKVPHELEETMQRLRKEASVATIRRHPSSKEMLNLEDLLVNNLMSTKDVENMTSPGRRFLCNLIGSLFSWQEGLSELARDDATEQTERFEKEFAGTMMKEIKAMNDFNTEKMFQNQGTFRLVELVR